MLAGVMLERLPLPGTRINCPLLSPCVGWESKEI